MHIVVFDDMLQVTDEEVKRMLPLVSEERRRQALRFRFTFGQYACLKSYLMLAETLPMEWRPLQFTMGPYGKPSLLGHADVHFNLSHCQHGIAVVVHNRPVGIDIECFHTAEQALLERTMNEQEQRLIAQDNRPDEAFTAMWTKKEAVLKLKGTGIVDDLHTVLADEKVQVQTFINREGRYAYSIAMY
ncbi:MAG: 4'-phosphopantetheinyl transferase superfamily protein [Bacteroidales bacterium]|nr:4'-phosphopantetheinyl transferase superfamily protein [Bacteroidales bacterium]